MSWLDEELDYTVEGMVNTHSYLRLHTFDNLAYKFVYNVVDLSISVYTDNSTGSFIFNVNKQGLYFINPRMKEKLEYIFRQHQ